jgi:NADPH:quinone reductase
VAGHRAGRASDALRLEDRATGPGQVLVWVCAAALNFPGVLLCRGAYQVKPPLPFAPGLELCGEAAALGEV